MKPLQIVFPSRVDPESPVIDLDLHLPLLCFRPEKVRQILTCLLMEQRMVFFSSSWALLPLVAECFLAYLHPLQWQHTFVPVLSRQMLDFVMAPTSFLMGCHLDYFEEVSKVRPWPFAVECQILVTPAGTGGEGLPKGPAGRATCPGHRERVGTPVPGARALGSTHAGCCRGSAPSSCSPPGLFEAGGFWALGPRVTCQSP
ncbi:DENN domain-containing protein 3-like [Ursus arctos]|uniref:DENN domain-containing protein 3-like n=1 Tax=Ursus arctos TaxID=9644 RepID=UPI0025468D25|nr:DENN domain-containing protein 3-like [Ursus arctos]XP_057168846.1 DENN domain-containing protein 3-like [Ursus arctos]XP_057168991.1 DENN domain-containing protein 3-like [Ursus arctos]